MGAVQVAARRTKELEAWLDVRVREDWRSRYGEGRGVPKHHSETCPLPDALPSQHRLPDTSHPQAL